VRARGLQGRVLLPGFVNDASRYLKALDCFLLPSIKEGLPYVILEAGLAALPVIATTVGGVPEIIEDQRTGILASPHNTTALAGALDQLIASPTLRTSLGTSLHKKVTYDFSLDQMIASTSALYKKTA